MYSKDQSYEMEQQQQQEMSSGHINNNGSIELSQNPNSGSLSSLVRVRVSGMAGQADNLYDCHNGMTGIPIPLSLAQSQQQQQQQQQQIANYRYLTMPQMQQLSLNHVMPAEYMHISGYPREAAVGNHVVNMQNPALIGTVTSQPYNSIAQSNAHQSFDRCPAICSLFAIFCCPITCWCSLPALIYSICAYTDYRAADMHHYRSKSDIARRLIIIACIIGLILCICWAILTFLYYDVMLALLSDIIPAVQRHLRLGL